MSGSHYNIMQIGLRPHKLLFCSTTSMFGIANSGPGINHAANMP